MSAYAETIDLRDIARAIRRGWVEIVAFTVLGTVAAVGVLLYAPRKFDGSASAVVQTSDPQGSALSRVGGAGGARGAVAGGLLSGVTQTPLETEVQIIGSRAVGGPVVDSLLLQARVRAPADVPSNALVRAVSLPGSFRPRRMTFERA